jgi:hypothetical protein
MSGLKQGNVDEIIARKAGIAAASLNESCLKGFNNTLVELQRQTDMKETNETEGTSGSKDDKNVECLKAAVMKGGFDPKSYLASKFRTRWGRTKHNKKLTSICLGTKQLPFE